MSNVLRLAIVDPNDSTRDALKAMLLGMEMIWLEAECSRYEFLPTSWPKPIPTSASWPSTAIRTRGWSWWASWARPARVRRAGGQLFQRRKFDPANAAPGRKSSSPSRCGSSLLGAIGRIGQPPLQSRRQTPAGKPGDRGGRGHRRGRLDERGREHGLHQAKDEKNSVALVDLDLCLGDADVSWTRSPTTRWSTWPRTSPGSTSRS